MAGSAVAGSNLSWSTMTERVASLWLEYAESMLISVPGFPGRSSPSMISARRVKSSSRPQFRA
jgi:hypothetical protein